MTDREASVWREVIAAKAAGMSLATALEVLTILQLDRALTIKFWGET